MVARFTGGSTIAAARSQARPDSQPPLSHQRRNPSISRVESPSISRVESASISRASAAKRSREVEDAGHLAHRPPAAKRLSPGPRAQEARTAASRRSGCGSANAPRGEGATRDRAGRGRPRNRGSRARPDWTTEADQTNRRSTRAIPSRLKSALSSARAQTPAGGPVPRDQDHEGGGRPRHEQPGRLATSLGDEEPGANRGDCEDHKPELLVQSDRPGPLGRLPDRSGGRGPRTGRWGC